MKPKGIKEGSKRQTVSHKLAELLDQCPRLLRGSDCENCPKKNECLDVFTGDIRYEERSRQLMNIIKEVQ